jgi:hypothetical protein
MTKPRKLHTIVGAAAAVGLAAAGAAVAADRLSGTATPAAAPAVGSYISAGSGTKPTDGPGRGGPHHDIADAAAYLGLTEAQLTTALSGGKTLAQVADATSGKSASGLIDALVAAEKTEIAADVKAGRLTQAQADERLANLRAHETAEVNGTFRGHGPGGRGHGGPHAAFTAAAAYLGLDQSALETQLRSGKTLAQVAEATSGKSKAGLIAAIVAAEKTELAAAVKAGRLTQADADKIGADLTARVTDLVEGKLPPRGDHDGRGHGPDGFRPAGAPAAGTHI